MPTVVRYTLVGLGNIGRNLLDILAHRRASVLRDYGLDLVLVGAVDSRGAAVDSDGLDPAQVRDLKLAHQSVCNYPLVGRPKMTALEMLHAVRADMLVEVSPTNLQDGHPGLACISYALGSGQHVVTANKGPLVLAFDELMRESRRVGRKLLYSGTVAGGLPTVNLGVRDLAGSDVLKVEGIFNGTTNYILTRMEQEQIPYEQALRGAQEAGIAEADPTLDVDGWDAANKLVIIANAVLRRPTRLADLSVKGIRQVTLENLSRARTQGQALKLLAIADRQGDDYVLSVGPTLLPQEHVLARTGMWDMGVVYTTDYMGVISAVIEEKGPVPTSAAVLRDMINVYSA
jgi:homoserine dehydrogenase